jgi:hypothetical protein
MNPRTAKEVYRVIQKIRKEEVFEKIDYLEKTQWLDKKEIESIQLEKLSLSPQRREKMRKNKNSFPKIILFLLMISFSLPLINSACLAESIRIDHTSIELSEIPDYWIDQVKGNLRIYYGHTSHGSQLIHGLKSIEAQQGAKYRIATGLTLPKEPNALCIRDRGDTYDPRDFFPTVPGALDSNPEINVVMYGWCGQASGNNWQSLLNNYIDTMKSLEQQYPNVTFVYMTGNTQEADCAGCNRHRFNETLRKYCKENNKVLFDFADLDVWYKGKINTYLSPGWCACLGSVPREHPHWGGGNWDNPCGHSTYGNCEQKGRAVWWMLARIRGWNPKIGPSGNQQRVKD